MIQLSPLLTYTQPDNITCARHPGQPLITRVYGDEGQVILSNCPVCGGSEMAIKAVV
ncbi:MAG: hypothetical protein M0Q91_07515 [Methanoregula sp.]|jgi:hypothetical protein|nr:hypothetical protein [Methanoregula sp.]